MAGVKLVAVVGFIVLGLGAITGIAAPTEPVGMGQLTAEPFFAAGIKGAGSIVIVIFTYAGFKIIGLAASETRNPVEEVPKAIRH